MIKIAYKESSIECSTEEEMRAVLLVLNEIRKENAKEKASTAGLQVAVRVNDLTVKDLGLRATARRELQESRKGKMRVH